MSARLTLAAATILLAATGAALPALAQAPRGPAIVNGVDPATGARPGNVIGTGQSLPLSAKTAKTDAATTKSEIAPRLPTPAVGEDADVRAYLLNARTALAAGRTGEAQESLERAESRLLSRDVAPSRAGVPDSSPSVTELGNARRAIGSGDPATAVQLINAALARLGA